jgi:sugar/nucleoside kinase (ribokinase family)
MSDIPLVIVGSVGLDTVETPLEKRENILGGSVSYACAAASFFGGVGMVGVIGDDFPNEYLELYEKFGIDTEGLQREKGKTFTWSGVYEQDMNNRRTVSIELNVFGDFKPSLPAAYRDEPFLFLGNISPELQLHVLAEVNKPRFVAADTMDLWIENAKEPLLELVSKVDMLMINDSEVRMLADDGNTVRAARKVLGMGPEYVVVKKGEHGASVFSRTSTFMVPAYPLEDVHDPTGAGDTFAGGFMGFLAKAGRVDAASVRQSMMYGSVMASFGCEAFSLDRIVQLDQPQIDARFAEFKAMITA